MRADYRFASQRGDIPADPETLDRPFLLNPGEAHPSLTVRDYFDAVLHFILISLPETGYAGAPERVIIRSEKHGALYHVASAEVDVGESPVKFAVSSALTHRGKACLNGEETLLRDLNARIHPSYLPNPLFKTEISAGGISLSMLLSEWFEDYHEWHLGSDRSHAVRIWDRTRGHRFASEQETFDLFREMSKILTHYYDPEDSRQIRPWHHAAGDFAVRTGGGVTSVRLTTARGYEPLFTEALAPVIALVYFFLDLSTRMRLDRIEGIGEVVWADDFCIRPVVEGFLDAFRIRADRAGKPPGNPECAIELLRTFTPEEMVSLFRPLLQVYEREDAGYFPVIRANLVDHAAALRDVIRTFPG